MVLVPDCGPLDEAFFFISKHDVSVRRFYVGLVILNSQYNLEMLVLLVLLPLVCFVPVYKGLFVFGFYMFFKNRGVKIECYFLNG